MRRGRSKPSASCRPGLFWVASIGILLYSCQKFDSAPGIGMEVVVVADKSDLLVTENQEWKQKQEQGNREDGEGNGRLSVRNNQSTVQNKKGGSSSNKSNGSWQIEDSHKWWTTFVADLARTWEPPSKGGVQKSNNESPEDDIDDKLVWCHPVPIETQQQEELKGLVYIKVPKTSSSTLRGVNQAIARHVGDKVHRRSNELLDAVVTNEKIACEHFDSHQSSQLMDWEEEYQFTSLFWTFVRNPISRDLSELYHFSVTRENVDPYSPEARRIFVVLQNTQIQYMSMEDDKKVSRRRATLSQEEFLSYLKNRIKSDIIEKYNFIGTLERRIESFAVMSLLWNIDPTSFIVLSAKQANGKNYDGGGYYNTCFRMVPAPKSPEDAPPLLAKYIQSANYTENQADFLLYDAVNESLDRTIAAIGVDKVQARKDWIEKLQVIAEEQCSDEAIYPCSKDGHRQPQSKQSCYVEDSGCGHACVDRVMQEYRGKHQLGSPYKFP